MIRVCGVRDGRGARRTLGTSLAILMSWRVETLCVLQGQVEHGQARAQGRAELTEAARRRLPAGEIEASEELALKPFAPRLGRILGIGAVKVGGREERLGDHEHAGLDRWHRVGDQSREHDEALARRQIERIAGFGGEQRYVVSGVARCATH